MTKNKDLYTLFQIILVIVMCIAIAITMNKMICRTANGIEEPNIVDDFRGKLNFSTVSLPVKFDTCETHAHACELCHGTGLLTAQTKITCLSCKKEVDFNTLTLTHSDTCLREPGKVTKFKNKCWACQHGNIVED